MVASDAIGAITFSVLVLAEAFAALPGVLAAFAAAHVILAHADRTAGQ
jgi:hypothetical protein